MMRVFDGVEIRVVGCVSEPVDILTSVVNNDPGFFVDGFQFEEVEPKIIGSRFLPHFDPMDDHETFSGCRFGDHDHGGVFLHGQGEGVEVRSRVVLSVDVDTYHPGRLVQVFFRFSSIEEGPGDREDVEVLFQFVPGVLRFGVPDLLNFGGIFVSFEEMNQPFDGDLIIGIFVEDG